MADELNDAVQKLTDLLRKHASGGALNKDLNVLKQEIAFLEAAYAGLDKENKENKDTINNLLIALRHAKRSASKMGGAQKVESHNVDIGLAVTKNIAHATESEKDEFRNLSLGHLTKKNLTAYRNDPAGFIESVKAKQNEKKPAVQKGSDYQANNSAAGLSAAKRELDERNARDAATRKKTDDAFKAEQAALKATQGTSQVDTVRNKLMNSLGSKTTADPELLKAAAATYVPKDYDSKARRRELDKNERKEIQAEKAEKKRDNDLLAHGARMTVQQMENDEKYRIKKNAADEKDAQKRYVRSQQAAIDTIALRNKEAEAVKAAQIKETAAEEKEAQKRYIRQHQASINAINERNKEAEAMARIAQRRADSEVNRDDRSSRAWTQEQARREQAVIDRDQSNADEYEREQERRTNAAASAQQAQATSAHRVGMALTVGITYPLIQLGKAAVKATEDMSKIEAGMTATMGSAQLAGEEIKRLALVSTLPGLNFKDMVQGSLTLQNTGMTAAGAEKTVRAFGNALAKAGKGSEELKGVELALQQIMSKGKLVGQELRQLQERLPMIRQMSEKAFGTADTQELVKQGIGAQEYILGIVAALEQEKQVPDNFANAMKNLSNEMFLFQNAVGKALAPAITSTANNVTRLTRSFREMPVAAQTMGVQVAALAAGGGPLLLLTSQILQIQVATAAWRREMALATGQALTMGQVIRTSIAGRMGVAALGMGVGILGGTLIAGDQTRNASGTLTEAQYKRSILAGGFTGYGAGASVGFMVGNVPGALIGGTIGGITGMLAARAAATPVENEVPINRNAKSFAETGVDKNADEIREAFSKNADKERSAWYANKLLEVDASVRPNKYGNVSAIDRAKAEIEKAKFKYAQDMKELSELKKSANESAIAAQKHYKDLYDKNLQLTTNEDRKLAWFDPKTARSDDPVLKQYNEDTINQNARIEILKGAKDYADSLANELSTFDDTTRKQLIANTKMATITKAQDAMRAEELRISKVEKTAMKDTALSVAMYGESDTTKQKIAALDTYNRTIEDLTEKYEEGEDVTNRLALAMATYQTTMYAVNEAEADMAKQENRAKAQASDTMYSIGEENELVMQEIDARRTYWNTMEDLTKDFNKGINVEGRYALASASYQKQHSDIMKADAIDKRTMAAATKVNAYELYALQWEMATIGSDLMKDTDPRSGMDDYNKYWAASARIESSRIQREVTIQNTPVAKRIPNAQALSDAQYNAERIALDKSWIKTDKDRTDKETTNILSRIKLNREEADKYTEDQNRMMEAAKEREKSSIQFLGSGSELNKQAQVLGAQQRLNGSINSSTLWNRGQQPEFWEIVKALQDIADEARRLADTNDYTKQMGTGTRPAPAYDNSLMAVG